MAKRKSNAPFNKQEFLTPRMEATEYGFFVREIGGKSLLEFKEAVEELQKTAGEGAELKLSQAINLMAKFVVLSACDADGRPIFDDSDLSLLENKNPDMLLDIVNQAMPLSGMNPKAFSEVSVDLPNDLPAGSTIVLPKNSIKRSRR